MSATPNTPETPTNPAATLDGGGRLGAMPCYTSSCGRVVLHLGDSLELRHMIPDDAAIISDPPYGMDWAGGVTPGKNGNKGGKTKHHGIRIEGDAEPFDPSPWIKWPKVVLWGMQHYGQRLPVGSVLVWVKRFEQAYGTFLSDADLAWMKGGHGVYCRQGPMPQAMAANRLHPTQKPHELMQWCIEKAGVATGTPVADPYMGSGSTGIAALRNGHRFIGIERDPAHYATALERIKNELAQGDLFHGCNV